LTSQIDRALTAAALASDPDEILLWLSVAAAWESREEDDKPDGFARIGPGEGETHRIVLCISPGRVAAVLDPRNRAPRVAMAETVAGAVMLAIKMLDEDLKEATK